MTSRKFCYLVVTKHVLPQKQRLPYPSVKVEKVHCVCLTTAIPYTYFPQLCKGASTVCITKIPETTKFQEHLSGQLQGTYAGLTMSLEWLKLHPSDTTHWSFCQFFFKNLSTFCDFCFLLQHKHKGDQIDADVVAGLPEPPLLIYYT